jgi:hypothetical protein
MKQFGFLFLGLLREAFVIANEADHDLSGLRILHLVGECAHSLSTLTILRGILAVSWHDTINRTYSRLPLRY